MPRENEAYRDNLERIKDRFPNQELLSIKNVRDFTGIKNFYTVKKIFPFQHSYISAATLARCLSQN